MSIIWHIVRKDIRRLRVPLALWILFLVAETVLFIYAGGAFTVPNLAWLGRMGDAPELFVRMFVPSMVVYLLVGWLVYGDPLVEPDPFWVTRPISGGQLFAAKLLGAMAMFVLPPMVVSLSWWLGSGLGWSEILAAGGFTGALFAVPVVVGIGMASATDNFQRYILWSFVALAVFGFFFGVGGTVLTTLTSRSATGGSTIATFCASACGVALVVGAHQFLTRRLVRSIGLAVGGAAAASLLAAIWMTSGPAPSISPVAGDLEKTRLTVVEPTRVGRGLREAKSLSLRLRADDLPRGAAVGQLRLQAEWREGDQLVWGARTQRGISPEMLQAAAGELLGVPARARPENGHIVLANIPMAAASFQQITERPAAFRGVADFTVIRGKILVEMPLRERSQRAEGRSFSISKLALKPLSETALKRSASRGETNDGQAIALTLTERMGDDQGLGFEFWKWRMPPTVYVILRRTTGEIIFSDPVTTGPTGLTQLNRVTVLSMGMEFVPPSTAGWLDDATFAVVRFENPQTLQRILTANPLTLEMAGRPVRAPQ